MAEVVGWDSLKRQFELYKDSPYYALFEPVQGGRGDKPGRLIFPYKGGDLTEGWELLKMSLQAGEQNAPQAAYVIQFYDTLGKGDRLDTSMPYSGSFRFRLHSYEGRTPATVSGIQPSGQFTDYLLRQLEEEREKVRELTDQVRELEDDIADLEKEAGKGQKPIGGLIGMIGEAGQAYPWMADMLKDAFTVFRHKVAPRTAPQGAGIAGVEQEEAVRPDIRINQALAKLVEWYSAEFGSKEAGFEQLAKDLTLLAGLTADTDVMHLALKKLRQMS